MEKRKENKRTNNLNTQLLWKKLDTNHSENCILTLLQADFAQQWVPQLVALFLERKDTSDLFKRQRVKGIPPQKKGDSLCLHPTNKFLKPFQNFFVSILNFYVKFYSSSLPSPSPHSPFLTPATLSGRAAIAFPHTQWKWQCHRLEATPNSLCRLSWAGKTSVARSCWLI